jgi:thiosulfate/3-mercaptopyruvate sulfurtransferase
MKLLRISILIFAGLVIPGPALISQARQGANEMLVSTDWLEEHLHDSLLVILHYGMKTEFEKEHIPGARFFTIWDVLVENEQGIRNELPDNQKIEQILRSYGINTHSTIVICYEDASAIPRAARLYFTLVYAGLGNQVSMLNGGLKAWKNEGRALTDVVTSFEEGNISIHPVPEILVSKEEVLTMLNNDSITIIDARPPEQYYGTDTEYSSSGSPHIEGAVNIPYFNFTQEDSPYMFKTNDELRQLLKDYQVGEGIPIITYCGTGVRASTIYFTATLLGYKVRLYDGSFQEWSMEE